MTAAAYPQPVPISSNRAARGSAMPSSASSAMRATMYGCEIVWPFPIGSAVSS
jgi:hypothetical protein